MRKIRHLQSEHTEFKVFYFPPKVGMRTRATRARTQAKACFHVHLHIGEDRDLCMQNTYPECMDRKQKPMTRANACVYARAQPNIMLIIHELIFLDVGHMQEKLRMRARVF